MLRTALIALVLLTAIVAVVAINNLDVGWIPLGEHREEEPSSPPQPPEDVEALEVAALLPDPPPSERAPAQPTPSAEPAASEEAARTASAAQIPVPDVNAMVILIRTAIVALNQANRTGDYSVLRDLAAPGFQQAHSPAQLGELFAELREHDVDLSPVVLVNPLLVNDPEIDERGFLRLTGFFPTKPERVNFDLTYQLAEERWRLFGIGVSTSVEESETAAGGQAGPEAGLTVAPRDTLREQRAAAANGETRLPDAATMVALIRTAVLALNQANMTGNYSVLHDIASPDFREANTPTRLGELFADLRARDLDLGPAVVIPPQLFRPPAIDDRGMLRLTGFFPSRPEQVNFDLAFQSVDDEWQLFGIGVNTSVEEPATVEEPGASTEAPSTGDQATALDAPTDFPAEEPTPARSEPPLPRLRPTL